MTSIARDTITSPSNPLIKRLRSLERKKGRADSGLFLAEGARLVAQGLDQGWQADTLLVASTVMDRPHIRELISKAEVSGARVIDVPERLINIESPVFIPEAVGISASDGLSYADIDVRDNRRDSLHTTVDTIEGARYFLTFYARNDGNGGDTDELRVRWNDNWATTILPGDEWQQYSLFL